MSQRDQYGGDDVSRVGGNPLGDDLGRASANPLGDVNRVSANPLDDDVLRRDEAVGDGASDPDTEVEEIRESIDQTRAEMSETLDELQERLSPAYLKEQVKEQVVEQYRQAKETVREATIGKVEDMVERVSDTVYDTRRGIMDTITSNPIPAGLVGIGLAWLWINRSGNAGSGGSRSGGRYRNDTGYDDDLTADYTSDYSGGGTSAYGRGRGSDFDGDTGRARNLARKAGDAVSGVAGQVQEAAGNLADRARETVSGAMSQAQDKATYVVDQAQHQARRVEQRFSEVMRDNPLAVGAAALALGTAVGMMVPQTRKENELMGEARDTFMDKSQSVAHDTLEQVQQVAQRATDEIGGRSNEGSGARQGGSV